MRDDKQGAVLKLLPDAPLDETICLFIHRARSLVEQQHFRPGQDRARETEKLLLSLGEVAAC